MICKCPRRRKKYQQFCLKFFHQSRQWAFVRIFCRIRLLAKVILRTIRRNGSMNRPNSVHIFTVHSFSKMQKCFKRYTITWLFQTIIHVQMFSFCCKKLCCRWAWYRLFFQPILEPPIWSCVHDSSDFNEKSKKIWWPKDSNKRISQFVFKFIYRQYLLKVVAMDFVTFFTKYIIL